MSKNRIFSHWYKGSNQSRSRVFFRPKILKIHYAEIFALETHIFPTHWFTLRHSDTHERNILFVIIERNILSVNCELSPRFSRSYIFINFVNSHRETINPHSTICHTFSYGFAGDGSSSRAHDSRDSREVK